MSLFDKLAHRIACQSVTALPHSRSTQLELHCVRVHNVYAFVRNVSSTFFAVMRSLLAHSDCNRNRFRVRNGDIRITITTIMVFLYSQ